MGQYPEVENGVRVVVPQLGPESARVRRSPPDSGGPETDFQSPPKVRLDSGGLGRTPADYELCILGESFCDVVWGSRREGEREHQGVFL